MIHLEDFIAWANSIVLTFGYFGIFAVSLVATSTVFLPTYPLSLIVLLTAIKLNPLGVGIAAGLGSATGELVGYFVGRGGGYLLKKKYKKHIQHLENLFEKYHGGLVIFFIAMIPIIPFDAVGLFAGSIKYDIKKLYIALVAGKTIRYTAIAFAGYYGVDWIMDFISA